jgi:hypothetical protein
MEEVVEFEDVEELTNVEEIEDEWITETVMESKEIKKTISKKVTVYVEEQRTRVEQQPRSRKVWRNESGCSSAHWETVTDYVNVSVQYMAIKLFKLKCRTQCWFQQKFAERFQGK